MPSGSKKRKAAKKPKPEEPPLSQGDPPEVEEEDGMGTNEEELTREVSLSPKTAEDGTEAMVGEWKEEGSSEMPPSKDPGGVQTQRTVLDEGEGKAPPPLRAEAAVQIPKEKDGLAQAEPEHGGAFEVAREDGTPDDIKHKAELEVDAEAEATPSEIKAENHDSTTDGILLGMAMVSIHKESDCTPSDHPDESNSGTTTPVVDPETNTGPSDIEPGTEESPAGVEPVIEANMEPDSASAQDELKPPIIDLETNTGLSKTQPGSEEAAVDVQHNARDGGIDVAPVEMELERESADPAPDTESAPVEVIPDSEMATADMEQVDSLQEAEREDATEVIPRGTEVVGDLPEIEPVRRTELEHEASREVEVAPEIISREMGGEVQRSSEIESPGEIAPEAESDVEEKVETPHEAGLDRESFVEAEGGGIGVLEKGKHEPEATVEHEQEPNVEEAKCKPEPDVEEAKHESESYVECEPEPDLEGAKNEPKPHVECEPEPDLDEAKHEPETHVEREPEPDLEEAKHEPDVRHVPEPDVEAAKHEQKLEVEYDPDPGVEETKHEPEPGVEPLQESDAPPDAEIAVIEQEAEVEIPVEGVLDHNGLVEEDSCTVDADVGAVQELEPGPEEEISQELHPPDVQPLEEGEADAMALVGIEPDLKVPITYVQKPQGEASPKNPPEREVVTDQVAISAEAQQDEESPPETEKVDRQDLLGAHILAGEGDEELRDEGLAEGDEKSRQQGEGVAECDLESRVNQPLELLECNQDASNLAAVKGEKCEEGDKVSTLEEAASFADTGPTVAITDDADHEPLCEEEVLQRTGENKNSSVEKGEETRPFSDEQMVGISMEETMVTVDVEPSSALREGAGEQVRAVEDEDMLFKRQDEGKLVKPIDQKFVAGPAMGDEGGVKLCDGEEEMAPELPPTIDALKPEKKVDVQVEDKEAAFAHGIRDPAEQETASCTGVEAGCVWAEDVSGDHELHPNPRGLDNEPTMTNQDNVKGDLESAVSELTADESQGGRSGRVADVKQPLAFSQIHDMSEAKARGLNVGLSNGSEEVPIPMEEVVAHEEEVVQKSHKQGTLGSSLPVVTSDVNQRALDHENPKTTKPTSGRTGKWLGCCGMFDALLGTG